MALLVKPDPRLEDALRMQPLRGTLRAYFEALERAYVEKLVGAAPDAHDVKTSLQGRSQMLAELKDLVK